MKPIYDYTDYRQYITEYIRYKNSCGISISMRSISLRIGFKSTSYLSHVLKGARCLSRNAAIKMAGMFGFNPKEEAYFLMLVDYAKSKNEETRKALLHRIFVAREDNFIKKFSASHYNYFSEWYYPILRHLAVFADWNGDFTTLANLVVPPITPEQAAKGIADLLDSRLLTQENGRYYHNARIANTDAIPAKYKEKGRKSVLKNAAQSINTFSPDKRFTTFYTMAIDEAAQQKIIKHFREFERKMMAEIDNSETVGEVRQVLFQSFPVSKEFRCED